MDVLSSILQLATPIGLAFIALIIVRENQKDRAGEIQRRDAREDAERDRQAKNDERFMLLFATLSGKQESSTAAILKSGVDSEARVNTQITASEVALKGRVQTVGDANIARLDKIDKALMLIQTAINLYSDPSADVKYDKALKILTAKLDDISEDITAIRADVATNTEVGTANTTAITDAADALAANVLATSEVPAAVVPAEVVITDVSPAAMDTIKGAMMPAPDAGAATAGEGELGEVA